MKKVIKFMYPITKFKTLFTNEKLKTQLGAELSCVNIAYQTYGTLNESRDNVIVICHALTGNAHAAGYVSEEEVENTKAYDFLYKYNKMFLNKEGWWFPTIGPDKAFDTNKYFIISTNILGSCYGTCGPSLPAEGFNASTFPDITVRDMVSIQKELLDVLEIKKVEAVAGGSLGGMQVLEWALMYPDFINKIIPIATSAGHSAWAIGLNETAREAIKADGNWQSGNYREQPYNGLSTARRIAMMSYKSYFSFEEKFSRNLQNSSNGKEVFQISNYLEYQGDKFVKRFDANSYLSISKAMDYHDIGKDRGSIKEALSIIQQKALCIGISSDVLYPPEEQREIANNIPGSIYNEIKSIHGHDAFLIEFEQLTEMVKRFL